jgi:hypothetical protein
MSEAESRSIAYELNRTPAPLAEHIDQALAKAALHKYESKKSPSGVLRSAWNYAEFALNSRGSERSELEEYFHTSQLLTAMVMMDPKTHQDVALNALTLSTYLPLFEKRSDDREVTNADCENIYRSLGSAMQYLRPLRVDEPPQWRMTEVGILALSARARQPHLLLYPTSPREESSGIQALNHDSYFFDTNGKIPIQQKLLPTQKVYDDYINIMTVQPLLDIALKKSVDSGPATLADKVNYLLSLIIAESTAQKLSRDEIKFLNAMTEAVVAHYFDAVEGYVQRVAA